MARFNAHRASYLDADAAMFEPAPGSPREPRVVLWIEATDPDGTEPTSWRPALTLEDARKLMEDVAGCVEALEKLLGGG